jgi:hypothetical protein
VNQQHTVAPPKMDLGSLCYSPLRTFTCECGADVQTRSRNKKRCDACRKRPASKYYSEAL